MPCTPVLVHRLLLCVLVCLILSTLWVMGEVGLLVASDYKAGQELIADREFAENAQFFQRLFEIARRYKIMNPGSCRLRVFYVCLCPYLCVNVCM